MSVDEKKSRKKKLKPENEIVSKFFTKKTDDNGEPAAKKNKITEDVDQDDSLKYFKKTNLRKLLLNANKDTDGPSTSKDTSISDFINKPSTSKEVKKAVPTKPKRVTKPKKPKSQTDIRKALSKKDEMIYDAINQSCNEDGVDPYEMQLALAISESLKDLNKEQPPKKEPKETKSFDNPFNSSGKITPISTILERYGFKSKRVYSEYEVEAFLNSKPRKRGKYQIVPTILTRTTDEKRELMISNRITDILESYLFADTQESEKIEIAKIEKKNPIVYNDGLMEMHELVNTCFRRSSEYMVHSDYFVTELFDIAHNKPGYLLKDWNKITGRDPSPERKKRKSGGIGIDAYIKCYEFKKAEKAETVSQDVKEGRKDDVKYGPREDIKEGPKEDIKEGPKDDIKEGPKEDIKEGPKDDIKEGPKNNVKDSPKPEIKESPKLEVTQDPKSQVMEAPKPEIKEDPMVILLSPNSSCSDIFEGIESFSIDELGVTKSEESLKAVTEHLELLHEKLSQSIIMHQDKEKLSDKNKLASVDLTQDESTNSDSTQEYEFEDFAEKQQEKPQTSNNDDEDDEIFDLTQCDSPKQEDIIDQRKEIINSAEKSEEEEEEIFDLTQCENYESPNMDRKNATPVNELMYAVENISSNDLTQHGNENLNLENENVSDEDEIFDLTQRASPKSLSKSSTFDENEIINISDDEINYSINRCQDGNSNSNEYPSNSFPIQQDDDIIEIDNLAEQSLIDMIAMDEKDIKIDNSVSELLNNFSEINKSINYSRKNRSIKFLETENLGDSIAEIMKKYGVIPQNSPKNKSISKMHSESDLEKFSPHNSLELEPEPKNDDDDVDLTIINASLSQNESQEKEDMDMSINKSLANILKSPMAKQSERLTIEKPRKSLGIIMNDKYDVDTETLFIQPDFENMTPHELKIQLFKYGIRPLPVKKAVQILTHIYNQMHPVIRVAIDEEIDMNDSRKDMNITDVATDIGMKGDDDEYVFQLDQAGIMEDEEYILPNVRKSKVPSCLVPFHISFYNMVRSNDKLQKYILEYRPVDLDKIYKHFRKFGLTYQTNDIIAFLDKRCITFKTKEQSCSKKHERKKQKRTQKS